jgi:hypothetical protein
MCILHISGESRCGEPSREPHVAADADDFPWIDAGHSVLFPVQLESAGPPSKTEIGKYRRWKGIQPKREREIGCANPVMVRTRGDLH